MGLRESSGPPSNRADLRQRLAQASAALLGTLLGKMPVSAHQEVVWSARDVLIECRLVAGDDLSTVELEERLSKAERAYGPTTREDLGRILGVFCDRAQELQARVRNTDDPAVQAAIRQEMIRFLGEVIRQRKSMLDWAELAEFEGRVADAMRGFYH